MHPRQSKPLLPAQHRLAKQERVPLQPPQAAASSSASSDDTEPPPWLKKIIGTSEYSTKFRLRRWLLFSGLVLGYSFYYLCRNSLNYVMPVMVNDPNLGLSITQLATMTSIFPIAYGALKATARALCLSATTNWAMCTTVCTTAPRHELRRVRHVLGAMRKATHTGASKFLSGVLGARTSPRLLLSAGLIATAIVNIMFGFSSSLLLFCVLWAMNGTLQVCHCLKHCSDRL